MENGFLLIETFRTLEKDQLQSAYLGPLGVPEPARP